MAKVYSKKTMEEKKKEVEALISTTEKKLKDYCNTPEEIKEYLSFMAQFPNYSVNNALLMEEQFPGAKAVGSFGFWKEKGFTINKGEKGIKILVPNKAKDKFLNTENEWVNIDKATKEEQEKIKRGLLETKKGSLYFSQGYVFDIVQTNATLEDLPKIYPGRWIDGDVKNYDAMYKGMEKIADSIGVKIVEPLVEIGEAKGASYPTLKKVVLNPRNTQKQNVKTLVHELTHAKLHNEKNMDNYSKAEKEFQAELTAYTVCSYLGIDTSEYSLGYIYNWTKDTPLEDKKELLKEVHDTANEYINILEDTLINETSISKENEKDVFLNLEDKVKNGMYVYYNQAPEEAIKVYSINDIKEHIASYMEPFFEDIEDEPKEWDKEVEKWDIEDIRDWFVGNEIVLSKESPQKLIEDSYKKEGKNEMLKPKKEEKEIRKMIAEHEEWLNSKGAKGKQLNLENANLKGTKLLNVDLRNANFKNADLSDCIIYADLNNANLTGAKINSKTKFTGSNLKNLIAEPKTLTLIDHQIKEENDKHKAGVKGLKTIKKSKEVNLKK